MKTCNYCKELLSLDKYSTNKTTKDGFSNRCKECMSAVRKSKRVKVPRVKYDVNRTEKACKKCKVVLPIDNFGKSALTADKREGTCVPCRKAQRRVVIPVIKNDKHCTSCKEMLPIENFSLDSSRNDGYDATCKGCRSGLHKNYYDSSKEFRDSMKDRSLRWRVENPERVIEQNAEYYVDNREAILEKRKKYAATPDGKWTTFKAQAKDRGIANTLTKEQHFSLIDSPCSYCGKDDSFVGIDRKDSDKTYSVENSVPCCSTCNYMKLRLSVSGFIGHLGKIGAFQEDGIPEGRKPVTDKSLPYSFSKSGRYGLVKSSAINRRGIKFDLSYLDFVKLWQKPCTYCGSTIDVVGLDRFDNSKGYTRANVVSCCWDCNNMKGAFSFDEFIENVFSILEYRGIDNNEVT